MKSASAEISQLTGNQVAYLPSDVRDVAQIQKALDFCISELGVPTLIINNAAGNFISPSERLSPNAVKTIVEIVLLGTLNTTLTIGKRLIKENKRSNQFHFYQV